MENNYILIIGVVFNTYPEVIRFANSLSPFLDNGVDLILVDNSTDWDPNFASKIQNLNSKILYHRTEANLGYFGGVRAGISHMKRVPESYTWTIVSNVDVVIEDQFFFEHLKNWENRSDLGILAPAIISAARNRNLNPKYVIKPSYAKMRFLKFIFSNWLMLNAYEILSLLLNNFIKKKDFAKSMVYTKPENVFAIYASHGSFIILHQRFFYFGGILNNPSFLFGEEIFLAEETIKAGLKIYYDSKVIVKDYEHASTGIFRSRKIADYMYKSVDDILKRYY